MYSIPATIAGQIMATFFARICWNSNGWVFPSGEAAHLEVGSYVADAGFGHEEWLFNFAWLTDGYHYAFLQPINKSFEKHTGTTIDLLLHAIHPNRNRVYVGQIRRCEVLTREQIQRAFAHYKRAGWLASMKEQIKSVEGDPRIVDKPLSCFNVRFRPADVVRFHPLRVAGPTDAINKLGRYNLVAADKDFVERLWRKRKGTKVAPEIRAITRSGQPSLTYDPIEKTLQAELLSLLQARFGNGNVELETDFVDITVKDGTKTVLVEIKSDGDARSAIRKALGQILEYAYFDRSAADEQPRLIIVAPGPPDERVQRYLSLLKSKFSLPVEYAAFSLGQDLPDVF